MLSNKNYTGTTGLILLVLAVFIQWGCKKENPVAESNSSSPAKIIEAPIGFAVVKNLSYVYTPATVTGPDFANGAIFYFEAEFNTAATWSITITDSTSGAVKTLSGTSSEINQSNASWDGSHDGLYYFNVGDKISATLTVAGSNIKLYSGTFSVTSFNTFPGYTGYIMGESGWSAAITSGTFNFDNLNIAARVLRTNGIVKLINPWPYYVTGAATDGLDHGSYGDSPIDPFFGGIALKAQNSATDNDSIPTKLGYKPPIGFAPIEGNGAYMLYGTDFNFDYFVSGMKAQTNWVYNNGAVVFTPLSQGLPAISAPGVIPFPSSDSLYFNIWIYGTGDVMSYFHWNIEEDDNGDKVHYDTYEDCYYYQIPTSHIGWKLFSIPYSAMLTAASPKNGGKGNHIQQPNQITAIGMQALSNPPGQTCKVIIDYPTITYGRPYNPNL